MSGGIVDKVYIGLDNAPAAFDIKGRILGPNGTNLEYIRSETGVVAVLKGDKFEALHLALHHTRSEALAAARSLAQNLIETIRAELAQWSAAQAGGPPPALNVPPPTLTTTAAPPPVPPVATVALSTPSTMTSTTHPTIIPPVVSVAPASTPLMTVRQPTVLQLLPQQQYVLNQENGQLIPIVQSGVQVSNSNFTSLPIAQPLGTIQQPNFGGTQIVDISNMHPVNVTQLRLSGVPSSMSMILPNGLTFPQTSLTTTDTTTVSSATSTPVVCAAQGTNSCQKIFYTDKGDKDIKYHIQGADTVQWTVPGSQTMLIPYQQLQELTSNQTGLTNIQPQQFVSIAPAGGLQTSLPLTAAQLHQLQGTGTIMHLNQKPIATSTSLINIISTGQASSPQIISNLSAPTKSMSAQEARGQKRLSDGTPNQLQLRPIAPAGSHVSQDKSSTRESRTWTAARDNTVVSMGMKINPAHGTIIQVSSGQQTNVSASGLTQEGTGMYIRHLDRNAIQIQASKDGQKQDITTNKIQSSAQNLQMITVPQGMTVLQNPINIGQMPTVLGQPNSQVYMIPANQPNIVQAGTLPPGIIGQQVLQPGQNVTVMQPNQLGVSNGVQYNVPLMPVNMPPNSQYMPTGINLNTHLSAQQLNAALTGQQLANPNLSVSGTIPIVQAPPPSSPMNNAPQTIPVSQQHSVQIIPQNSSFLPPTSQYASMPQQYMMQANSGAITMPTNNQDVQYTISTNQTNSPAASNGSGQSNPTVDNDSTNGATNQNNYITSSSQENGFSISGATSVQTPGQQNFSTDGSTTQTAFTSTNQNATQQNYATSNGGSAQNQSYNGNQTTTTQPPANYNTTNTSNPQSNSQNYAQGTSPASSQNASQSNFSPSTTPAPNQTYPTTNLPNMPNVAFSPNQNSQNPYPNATGQNLAAYASNQYQYTSRPWFRPRYGSPQGSPYNSGGIPPPNGPPMPVPPPSASQFMLKEIKRRQEQVNRGYQLLKRKAEALRVRGRQTATELTTTQAILDHTLKEAYISLAAVKFTNGEPNALVLENIGQAQVRVQRISENISGVATVSLQAVEDATASDSLRYAGLGAGGHRTGEAKKAFREAVLLLVKFASLRNTCILLDGAIRSTLRKVNGIEKVIMPKLRNTENYIHMEMYEREREEFHRLKMVKAKKIRAQALANLRHENSSCVGNKESKDTSILSFRSAYRIRSLECLTSILYPCTSALSSNTESGDSNRPICYPHNWDDEDLLF